MGLSAVLRKRLWLISVGCLVAMSAVNAIAESLLRPSLPSAVLPSATLVGGGNYRWLGLKIYEARLWAEGGAIDPQQWANRSLALELVYARELNGREIAAASIDEMKKGGLGSPSRYPAWLEAMGSIFPDVEDGTQLIGVYGPSMATRFYHNGKFLGEVSDPAFGPAFFGIWLHAKTTAPKLRSALFGGKS